MGEGGEIRPAHRASVAPTRRASPGGWPRHSLITHDTSAQSTICSVRGSSASAASTSAPSTAATLARRSLAVTTDCDAGATASRRRLLSSGTESAACVSCGGLDPDVFKNAFLEDFAICNTVQGATACEAKIFTS